MKDSASQMKVKSEGVDDTRDRLRAQRINKNQETRYVVKPEENQNMETKEKTPSASVEPSARTADLLMPNDPGSAALLDADGLRDVDTGTEPEGAVVGGREPVLYCMIISIFAIMKEH